MEIKIYTLTATITNTFYQLNFLWVEGESEKERKIHCLSTVFSGNMNNLGLYHSSG
jgi:hypothetical protein